MSISAADKSPRLPAWLAALALALVTLAVYWPATQAGLLNCDDDVYITTNPRLAQGLTWENVTWFFTHPYFSNWHPLTMWSYLLDYEVWGPKAFGFHLTNILLHAVNTALVFWVLRQLTGTGINHGWTQMDTDGDILKTESGKQKPETGDLRPESGGAAGHGLTGWVTDCVHRIGNSFMVGYAMEEE